MQALHSMIQIYLPVFYFFFQDSVFSLKSQHFIFEETDLCSLHECLFKGTQILDPPASEPSSLSDNITEKKPIVSAEGLVNETETQSAAGKDEASALEKDTAQDTPRNEEVIALEEKPKPEDPARTHIYDIEPHEVAMTTSLPEPSLQHEEAMTTSLPEPSLQHEVTSLPKLSLQHEESTTTYLPLQHEVAMTTSLSKEKQSHDASMESLSGSMESLSGSMESLSVQIQVPYGFDFDLAPQSTDSTEQKTVNLDSENYHNSSEYVAIPLNTTGPAKIDTYITDSQIAGPEAYTMDLEIPDISFLELGISS